MRKRIYGALLALGMGGALVAFSPMAAEAACPTGSTCTGTANLTATLTNTSIGSRSITLVATPGAFSSVMGNAGLTSSLQTLVTETAIGGTNPWYVTGVLAGAWSDGTNSIPASALADTANNTVQVAGGGTVDQGTTGTLDGAQTLVKNTGQTTSVLYTGTYTTTTSMTLTPPNGTVASGVPYTNVLDLTLIQ